MRMVARIILLVKASTLVLLTSSLHAFHVFHPREMDCPLQINGLLEHSYKVPWGIADRAIRTAPPGIVIRPSAVAGLGTFAETFIKAHTWLGEYDGVALTRYWDDEQSDDTYMFRVYRRSYIHHYIDAVDIRKSSWTRFVNGASYPEEQNVVSAQCYDRVFFRLTKDVAPGAELLVFYGIDYSRKLGVNVSLFDKRY